jgi:hypothetical protein
LIPWSTEVDIKEETDVNISIMKIDRITEFASSFQRQQLIRQKSVSDHEN